MAMLQGDFWPTPDMSFELQFHYILSNLYIPLNIKPSCKRNLR